MKGAGFLQEDIKAAFDKCGLDSGRRGETFSLEEFGILADAFVQE